MKKLRKRVSILFILIGLVFCGLGLPEVTNAIRTSSFTGEINFDMRMDDGSLIPAGKVPTANVDYAVREYSFLNPGLGTDKYINQKQVIIPYDGAGNFSHSETNTFRYGVDLYQAPSRGQNWSRYHTYYNLNFTAPAYIRSISAKSSVLGDYSHYTQQIVKYSAAPGNENTIYVGTTTNGLATIPNPNLTRTGPGAFKYTGSTTVSGAEHPDTVQFAVSGGAGDSPGGAWDDYEYNFSSLASNGKRITFFLKAFQVTEIFRDDNGGNITPPNTFEQFKVTDADSDLFTHTMKTLPTSYTTGGNLYVLKGWYQGATKPATLNTTNPPSITMDYTQPKPENTLAQDGQIFVIYAKSFNVKEKYVDASGATINGGAWDNTSPIANNGTFNGSPAPTKIDGAGDEWEYVGWKKGVSGTVTNNPVTVPNIVGNEDIYYIYQRSYTDATLDLKPTPQIVDNGDTVSWSSKLTNTGATDLKNLVLKSTSNWAAGLTDPVKVSVTPAGGAPQDFTVNPGDWATGVNLTGITIPNAGPNNYADITFTTTATGAVNQVLPAEIEVAGNIPTPITAENFVRIDDPDEPNLEPSGNGGLINIPDFRFGDVEVKPFAQTKKLDASLYQAGYHPYIRMMDNESNFGWELTVKLGQFTSGAKTLPTSTSITLRNGRLMEVQNYNKPNESFGLLGLEGTKVLPSDGTTVSLTDHTAKGVYQLEYDLNNDVELNLMAHSGIAGLDYEADMDWTLTTSI